MLCTFYGGYCSLWPNRTARSLSRAWPSLLRAHNHIGGATAVPLHHKKCLLYYVLIYMVVGFRGRSQLSTFMKAYTGNASHSSPFHGYWSDTNILADICAQHCHRDIGCLLVVFCFDFFQYAARTQDPTSWHFCVKIL